MISAMHIVVIIAVLCLLTEASDPSSNYDKMKQDLVISQFREKLLEKLSELGVHEPILAAASHDRRNRNRNPYKPLNKVHGISIVVEDQDPVITKMIFPGFKKQKEKDQSFEFRLPKTISSAMIKSAKLFIYVDKPGRSGRGWRIKVVNSARAISKKYRVVSKAKLQHFIISDMVKAYLDNVEMSVDKPYLTLRLVGEGDRDIKSIMLIISAQTAPKRSRRSTSTESSNWCTNSSLYCCIQRFSVHPSRLYLQNLISPDVIQLNYCKGDCNYYIRGKSNYAKALGLLKRSKISPLSARQLESMRSCCAPQEYSKIRIKLLNDQTQQLMEKIVNDMIVSSCGCY